MKQILKSSEIVVGEKYLFFDNFPNGYFKENTIIEIYKFDGTDFWAKNFDKTKLTDNWFDYDELCVGNPENENTLFYELEN